MRDTFATETKMALQTKDFDFELPQELIASRPLERRDDSRMMVVNREKGTIEHCLFKDILDYKQEGDCWVFNDTKVVKARYFSNDQKIELLRVEMVNPTLWRSLVKPGKRMKVGRQVAVGSSIGTVVQILENGERLIEWDKPVNEEEYGELALPHYMERAGDEMDDTRYQTVYADKSGAIAAPTAGLHFTPEIIDKLPAAYVTLHVGVGTFRPVNADRVDEHEMHSENYFLSEIAAEKISQAKRTVCVGTTSTRVLESIQGDLVEKSGDTDIFIYPPYQFRHVDALLTNFHLPQSTLIMLVSALASRDLILEAYTKAVEERYRFFSYGDCMLII